MTLEIEDVPVSDVVPFWQYLDLVTRSMSIGLVRASSAATGELGSLGYVVALLQLLGFAAGGFLVYAFLADLPYCADCSRYLAAKGSLERYTPDHEALVATATAVLDLVRVGDLAGAIAAHKTFGGPIPQAQDHLCATITVRHCKKCGQHWMKFTVLKGSGNDWTEIPELTASRFTHEPIGV